VTDSGVSGGGCGASAFLGFKRYGESYGCELERGHGGWHRCRTEEAGMAVGEVVLRWKRVEDEEMQQD